MKTVSLPAGRASEHTPAHPERTARRHVGSVMNEMVEFKEFPARSVLARMIRMQERRERRPNDWRAVQPLETTEGY